ncbi:hypothetical protein GGR56DRAFT_113916 [Xylariaceae sp. FL0804]|nr:hypothetical protein GGR56DRAFT_113916 [Xylariaceae sp. FL0804]
MSEPTTTTTTTTSSDSSPQQQQITVITLTPAELASRRLGSRGLQAAVEALHRDGLVALANAVDRAHLDRLNARMVPEARALYARPETHRNFGDATGNIQQEPVLEEGYIFEDVIANPWATQIIQCMLGPKPTLRFYSANTAFKATGRQPPHIDVDFDFPKIPFGFCVNIPLVATSPLNGATEVWPGSHADTDASVLEYSYLEEDGASATGGGSRRRLHKQIRPDLQAARRAAGRPPLQPNLPQGALVIRDFRLWHAGMPNLGRSPENADDDDDDDDDDVEPRVMLVTVLFPSWYRSDLRVRLPESLRRDDGDADADGDTDAKAKAKGKKFDWGDLVPCVDWVPDGYDYLQGAHDHDFALQP